MKKQRLTKNLIRSIAFAIKTITCAHLEETTIFTFVINLILIKALILLSATLTNCKLGNKIHGLQGANTLKSKKLKYTKSSLFDKYSYITSIVNKFSRILH